MQVHNFHEYLNPTFLGQPTHSDSSGAIFSMYISRAQKFDEENLENWKRGADGILVFVCSESLQPR